METTAAKNYLENTNLTFKFKAGAAIGTAAYLLILVLIEEIAGAVLPSFWGDIYLIGGIALMVITGSIYKALKVAKGVFKWGYLLTPFVLFDVVIAVIAGGFVLGVQLVLPFIPMALDTLDLYKERQNAKQYL